MGKSLKLECFDSHQATGSLSIVLPEAALEEERLQSFDKGYKAGWDDAANAHSESQTSITAEFADNLQRLSFTYHEARNSVLAEMDGILRGMVSKVLPPALQASLGEMILQRVSELSVDSSDVPVEIVVSPKNRDLVRDLVSGKVAPPLTVMEEVSLGEGQAFLRLGQAETKFDLDAVLAEISVAVSDFFDESETAKEANRD